MLSIQQVEGRMYFSNIKHYVRPNVIGIHTFAYIIKHNARTLSVCAMITFTACSKNAVYRNFCFRPPVGLISLFRRFDSWEKCVTV